MFFRRNKQAGPIRLTATPFVSVGSSDRAEPRKKVLIVDDDPVIVKTLMLTLQSAGYEVATATDGGEAIGQVQHGHPDLMIVDVFLAADPVGCGALGWDGFQVARWIGGLNSKAPIVIISGSNDPDYETQTMAAGARAFLTKPIDNILLLSTIESLLAAKKPVGSTGQFANS